MDCELIEVNSEEEAAELFKQAIFDLLEKVFEFETEEPQDV